MQQNVAHNKQLYRLLSPFLCKVLVLTEELSGAEQEDGLRRVEGMIREGKFSKGRKQANFETTGVMSGELVLRSARPKKDHKWFPVGPHNWLVGE